MSEWISVEDRIPEDDSKDYLCVIRRKSGERLMMVCWWNPAANNGEGCWVAVGKQPNVTHWRELPEMPEE